MKISISLYFNPRSHEGSDYRLAATAGAVPHFNPRSHEGSDEESEWDMDLLHGISICAPTRGATNISDTAQDREMRFQSALPRGERQWFEPRHWRYKHFNPRSHEGSDSKTVTVSRTKNNFNPRSHEGSDYNLSCNSKRFKNFNPRSHEGSDAERYTR